MLKVPALPPLTTSWQRRLRHGSPLCYNALRSMLSEQRAPVSPQESLDLLAIYLPVYPVHSSGDDDSVRMRCRPCTSVDQALGHGVELEAAVEAPSKAGEIALGV